jgi:hypothetical protein
MNVHITNQKGKTMNQIISDQKTFNIQTEVDFIENYIKKEIKSDQAQKWFLTHGGKQFSHVLMETVMLDISENVLINFLSVSDHRHAEHFRKALSIMLKNNKNECSEAIRKSFSFLRKKNFKPKKKIVRESKFNLTGLLFM